MAAISTAQLLLVAQALREQLALIFAPTGGPGGSAGGSPMEGLLEMEELLRGSFLRPQLDRFFEGLEGWKLDLELMVRTQ